MYEFYKHEPEDGASLEDEGSCFNALELYVDERRKEEMAGSFRLDQPLQAAAHDTGWQYGT